MALFLALHESVIGSPALCRDNSPIEMEVPKGREADFLAASRPTRPLTLGRIRRGGRLLPKRVNCHDLAQRVRCRRGAAAIVARRGHTPGAAAQ
jgi:hypothetical protein